MTPDSYIAAFADLFGPVPADAAPATVDWDAVESWLGVRLPADYKAIASAYGPLDIGERLWLHMPCAREGWFEYASWLDSARRDAPDGLLPWGETRMCDVLYWDTTTSDDPDAWPVVAFHKDGARAGADPWHHYGTPLLPALATFVADGRRPYRLPHRGRPRSMDPTGPAPHTDPAAAGRAHGGHGPGGADRSAMPTENYGRNSRSSSRLLSGRSRAASSRSPRPSTATNWAGSPRAPRRTTGR
jgi:hypothetical protein